MKALLPGNKRFRNFWLAETLSAYGSQITVVALPLTVVTVLHATPEQVGLLTFLQRISFPLFGLLVGTWLDKVDLRRTLVVSDLARGALILVIPVASWVGWLTYPLVAVITALLGLMYVFFEIAYIAVIPSLVDSFDDLPRANASMQASASTAGMLGPGLAGLLLGFLSAPATLSFDSASFLASASLLTVRGRRVAVDDPEPAKIRIRAKGNSQTMAEEVRIGWRRVWKSKPLRAIAQMSGIHLFFYTAFQTLMTLYMVDVLHLKGVFVAIFYGATGAGFLLGSIVCRPVCRALGIGRAMACSTLAADLAAIAAASVSQSLAIRWAALGVLAVIMGAGWQVNTLNSISVRQALTPPPLQARVNGVIRVVAWSAAPLGGLAGGLVAGQLGIRTALLLAAIGMLIAVVRIVTSPLMSISKLPTEPEVLPESEVTSGSAAASKILSTHERE